MTRPAVTDLYSDEQNQGLRYYPFMVNLDVMEVVIVLMIDRVKYVLQTIPKM